MVKNIRKIKKREEPGVIAVQPAIDAYLSCAHVKKLAKRTREEYEDELGVFGKWCTFPLVVQDEATEESDSNEAIKLVPLADGPVMLHQVNDDLIHLYLEYYKVTHRPKKTGKTELSTYTLNGIVRVIKIFLNWCLLNEEYSKHIQALTIKRIEKPQIIEVIKKAFTRSQIDALFAACEKEESEHLQMRDRAILSVLLDSGLRASELVTLIIGNVSLDAKDAYVRVLGKGSRWGEVGLGDKARRAVKKYIEMFREPTIEYEVKEQNGNLSDRQLKQAIGQQTKQSLVFVNRYGEPLTPSGLYQVMKRLEEWSGIEVSQCSPHIWRHTFSTIFMEEDGDIFKLSKLLRHRSVKTTEEYLKSLGIDYARKRAKSVLDNL